MLEERQIQMSFFIFKERSSKTYLKNMFQMLIFWDLGNWNDRRLNRLITLEENENETRGLACTRLNPSLCKQVVQ